MATDAEIREAGYKYIPQQQYLQNPFVLPTSTEEEDQLGSATGSGIPYTNAFTGGGGGGPLSTQNLMTGFGTAITDRQAKLNEMNRPMRPERRTANYNQPGQGVFTPAEQPTFKRSIQDFIYDKVPYIDRPQSYEDIMTKGYQKPTGRGLPTIFNFMNKMGIQNFASLPQSDQAFITSQKGYTGPTVFGQIGSNMGHSIDPFGKNVESMFGNYAEGVRKDYEKLSDYFGSEKFSKKYGDATLTLNEETGQYEFTGVDPRVVGTKLDPNYMNKMNLARYGFRKNQINKQEGIKSDLGLIDEARAEDIRQTQGRIDRDETNINRATERGQAINKNEGVGTVNPTSAYGKDQGYTGGSANPHTQSGWSGSTKEKMAYGGRVPFFYGGIATAL